MSPDLDPDLMGMPEEMRFAIFELLPPEALQSLRVGSEGLRSSVDSYVQRLLDWRQLRDAEDRAPQLGMLTAEQALSAWAQGALGNDAYPVRMAPLDREELVDRYNRTFTATAYPDWQVSMIEKYDEVINGGGPRALDIRSQLETYATIKVRLGEVIVDDREQAPYAADRNTPIDAVLNGIRGGTMRFR